MATAVGELLTLAEAARLLKVTSRTVYRLVSDGRLPALRLGNRGSYRIARADLNKALREWRRDAD